MFNVQNKFIIEMAERLVLEGRLNVTNITLIDIRILYKTYLVWSSYLSTFEV